MTADNSTCLPLLVSGEVIGSVLVDHEDPFGARDRRCLSESVTQPLTVDLDVAARTGDVAAHELVDVS